MSAPTVAGLVLRPYAGEQDAMSIVEIMNAEWAHDGVPGHVSVGDKRAEYAHASEQFDARRDLTIAELDGRAVGYAVRGWIDANDSHLREYRSDGSVLPAYRGRGIGRALLRNNISLAVGMAASHTTDRQRVIGSHSNDGQEADMRLLRSEGFELVRYFFDMGRPTLDDIPELPLPDGLEVRPLTLADGAALYAADVEAFRDHWGGFEDSPQEVQRWLEGPDVDPRLWVVAFDGDQIAGAVIAAIYPDENVALGKHRGWLDSVFTRRPWRGRGLARALISRALLLLRERGMTSAVLEVDAENPTGALGLYESVGFAVEHRSHAWRKPFQVAR